MYAPEVMEAIEASLHRNRAGLSNSPQNADTTTMGNSSPSMSLTLRSATSPDSRDGGATCATSAGGLARRVLQTNGKENWALSIGK